MDEKRTPMRVLIISEEEETMGRIRGALVTARDVVVVGRYTSIDAAQRHLAADSPDIVLLDLRLPDSMSFLELLAEEYPATAPIVLLSAKEMPQLQQALLAGARGFNLIPSTDDELFQSALAYAKSILGFSLVPCTEEDLLTTMRQVYAAELERRQRQLIESTTLAAAEAAAQGEVIAVSGIKGGVGRTFIAVNLAVALAQESGEPVALVEGHAGLGDVALLLNAHPPHALVDLVTDPRELDSELMSGALVTHASGIKVLFATRTIEDGPRMTPQLLAAALYHLRQMVRYVVVDTAPIVNEMLSEVLASADVVLVVTTPEVSSLRRAMLLLQAARSDDFPTEKLRLILNREGISGGISRADIAQRSQIPIAIALPDDAGLVTYSINRGVPVVQSHPKSLLARRIRELAKQLAATAQPASTHSTVESVHRQAAIHLPGILRFQRA